MSRILWIDSVIQIALLPLVVVAAELVEKLETIFYGREPAKGLLVFPLAPRNVAVFCTSRSVSCSTVRGRGELILILTTTMLILTSDLMSRQTDLI